MVCLGWWYWVKINFEGGGGEVAVAVAVAVGKVWGLDSSGAICMGARGASEGWAPMLGKCKAVILYVKREIKVVKVRVKRLRNIGLWGIKGHGYQ